jgi:hypothetical protein
VNVRKGYDGNCTNWNWKTFAYLLPLLKLYKFTPGHALKSNSSSTRELVVQVVEVEKLTKYMSVRTIGIFGGVNINTQKKLLFIKDVTYWWELQEESWI